MPPAPATSTPTKPRPPLDMCLDVWNSHPAFAQGAPEISPAGLTAFELLATFAMGLHAAGFDAQITTLRVDAGLGQTAFMFALETEHGPFGTEGLVGWDAIRKHARAQIEQFRPAISWIETPVQMDHLSMQDFNPAQRAHAQALIESLVPAAQAWVLSQDLPQTPTAPRRTL